MRALCTAVLHRFPVAWCGPVMCLFLLSCTPHDKGLRHPMYLKGVQHEKAGEFEKARESFEKCLRMEPGNRPAHVHLGMLYEDHFDDLIAAMYHYSRGCAGDVDDAHAQLARRSLKRIARAFAATHVARKTEPPAPVTDDEVKRLKHLVETLSARQVELESQLKKADGTIAQLTEELAAARLPTVPTDDKGEAKKSPGEIRVETIYTVKKGDTLYGIARERYGNAATWQELRDYNENVLKGSDLLRPGMKIRIPDLDTLRKEVGDGE